MKNRTVITLILLLIVLVFNVYAQQNPKEKDSLILTLKKNQPPVAQVKSLWVLGQTSFLRGGSKPGFDKALIYLERASHISDSLRSDTLKNESLLKTGELYFKADSDSKGSTCFMKVINSYQLADDKRKEAQVWMRLAKQFANSRNKYPFILNDFAKARRIYQQIHDKSGEIEASWRIAYYHADQGQFDLAEHEMLEVITIQNNIKQKNHEMEYVLLSDMNRRKGDLHKALYYSMKVMENMAQTRDTVNAANYYEEQGMIFRDLGDLKSSIFWYQKAFQNYSVNFRDRPAYIYQSATLLVQQLIHAKKSGRALSLMLNLIKKQPPADDRSILEMARSLAACYNDLKQYKTAEKYYLIVEKKINQFYVNDEWTNSAKMHIELAQFYIDQKKYQKAEQNLNEIFLMPPKITSLVTTRDAHFLYSKIDSAKGIYTSALAEFKKYKSLNDTLFNVSKTKQIEELQIGYATAQKEQDIKLLENKQKLQQEKLVRANNTQKAILAGVILLTLLLGISYNGYRLKQRKNKVITQKNELLQHLLDEKEWLLREVHHRVKNNLHTVICLLESQAAYLDNDALKAMESSRHRIFAMSLIHQKLYQTENVKIIDMTVFVPEFIQYLSDSYGTKNLIRFEMEIQPMKIDVSQAMPLSLIINEAVTNAIKYAFPEKMTGTIAIKMVKIFDEVVLTITDNGIGINDAYSKQPLNSFGLKLMKGLSEDINAKMDIKNRNGTTIIIRFKDDSLIKSYEFSDFAK